MSKTYTAKEAPPAAADRVFPMEIRHKKSAGVTIYQALNRGTPMYTIAYRLKGKRTQTMRKDFTEAFTMAQQVALQLGEGAADVLTLSGRDRFAYERAMEALSPLGVDLDFAMTRLVEASNLAGGLDHLVEAARFYAETKKAAPPPMMVADVVAELIENRRSNEKSELYIRDLRVRLAKRFAGAFQLPISSITTSDIEKFLHDIKRASRTKKNFLSAIGTLFNFAKNRGYLTDNHPCISKVQFNAESVREIKIFSPEEMAALLTTAKAELVPAMAIGAFAGIRSEEIKKLEWPEVKLEENHIEVLACIAKTGQRRLVPVSENLRQWLLPYRKSSGRVFPFANLAIQFEMLSRKSGIDWKKNGLRHSYISYRVAEVDSAEKVALEAGNSTTVIRRNYLHMVTKAKSEQWFAIKPVLSDNIIQMPGTGIKVAAAI
jgi:integrase